ncbi:MAG: peptidoglycan DD-metalloendopeptidase family protein [Bacilli bacterium]
MNKKIIFLTLIAFLISGTMVFLGFTPEQSKTPHEVYRVYLAGKSIGLIDSKSELENYIDKEQAHLKEIYKVSKVYTPRDLDIVKEITYNLKTSSTEDIYNQIKDISPFTINGYKILIRGIEEINENGEKIKTADQSIYVLDKNIFTSAIYKTTQAFINKDQLKAYENNTQKPIVDTGKRIENIYIKNDSTIVEENIPVDAKIYTTVEELSKYLLFGTVENQSTYQVKQGDTIHDVAFNNKISPEEFLIANTSFKTDEDLLFPGQNVVLGILKPQLQVVEENHIVERVTVKYETRYENDANKSIGYEEVKQEGADGIRLVTQKNQVINGEIRKVVNLTAVDEKAPVDKIVVRGTMSNSGGNVNYEVPVSIAGWVWPTKAPYTITSRFAWRWGKLHEGIDIAGPGEGSPIKAANNGVVVNSGYSGTNGNYINIKHSNGYYTEYAHMSSRYKKAGDVVYAGDIIGTMGHTGYAFGTHLHFGLWKGVPHRSTPKNPLSLF